MPKTAFTLLVAAGLLAGCAGNAGPAPGAGETGGMIDESEDLAYHRHHGHAKYADVIVKGFGH